MESDEIRIELGKAILANDLVSYMKELLRRELIDQGYRHDIIDAVMSEDVK